jgi:hypothetical protein
VAKGKFFFAKAERLVYRHSSSRTELETNALNFSKACDFKAIK